ncbi:hypothetical protein OGAPHI_001322 [Ogataea philodendri]|uniref:Major facilitator superfamily (MFS) profile domain-containing protein n=1 Tax=Ogataea philodendri TaxID=1378263 RepID=A0A9P8TA76_9ASCO|nr:uncharacterized protein OGAPHI_001322 [Ogataea philodendri]KAH3670806.1 hypothetical protein OGAPHI_001322 [Ogataea philodendri]
MDSQGALYDYGKFKHLSPLVPKNKYGLLAATIAVAIIEPSTLGMESSIMGSINSLEQYTAYFNLTDKTINLNTASIWIGMLLAVPFIRRITDGFGRKWAIMIAIGIMAIGVILSSASINIAMFIVGRIFLGLSSSIIFSAASILVSEICPPDIRGVVLGLFHACYYIGSLVAAGVTYATRDIQSNWSWRIPTITQGVPTVLCGLLLIFCPESPRWLMLKGKVDEAREIFYVMADRDAAAAEVLIEEVNSGIIEESKFANGLGLWKRQWQKPSNLRRAFIVISLSMMSELGGSTIATYYFTILLKQVGVTDTKTQLEVQIIRSAWCFVVACIGSYTFDIFGRKNQAMIATFFMALSLLILGGLVKKYNEDLDKSTGYGAIAMMFLFSGFYSVVCTPLTSLYPPEIYPNSTRVIGNSIFMISAYGGGLFSTFVFSIGMSNIGWKFYMIVGGYDMIFIPIIYYVWVETKGLTLEKISELFGDELSTSEADETTTESNPKLESVVVTYSGVQGVQ